MKDRGLAVGIVGGAAAMAAVVAAEGAGVRGRQASESKPGVTATSDATGLAARLSSQWKLNRDLSTNTSDVDAVGASGRPGNAGPGGTPSGRRRSGGRSGVGGGGRPGGRGGGDSQEQTLAARALMREAFQPSEVLNIVATAGSVSFTDNAGTLRRFTIDGKKETVDFGTSTVETRTSWNGDVLTQELSVGRLKLTRTFEVTVEGHQLVVQVSAQGDGRSGAPGADAPAKFVYDRSSGGPR